MPCSGFESSFISVIKRTFIATILISLSAHSSIGKNRYNSILKKELDSITADDQRYREIMTLQPGIKRDSIARAFGILPDDVNNHFAGLQARLDSINLSRITSIFHKHGYPGKSMVGEPANESAYYVIQHSDRIGRYFPIIEKAGKNGELPFYLVAMMQDRLLKEEGKEQIYGTQYAGFASLDSVTKQQKIIWFLWPVNNYSQVNERRKAAGFKDSVAENAAAQGIELHVISLVEAKKNYPWFFSVKK